MSNRFEGEFRGIADERYPGSSRPRAVAGVKRPAPEPDDAAWDRRPQRFKVGGVEREFFTVGDLAHALGRRPGTIRKWERDAVLPRATFIKPGTDGDPRGRRRLYSRDQVEGIIEIAREERVLDPRVQVTLASTNFTSRVTALFRALKEAESGNR